jgi:hypothetical protein
MTSVCGFCQKILGTKELPNLAFFFVCRPTWSKAPKAATTRLISKRRDNLP